MIEWLIRRLGLRRDEYVRLAVEAASTSAFLAGHASGQKTGYELGLAQGELIGRQKLTLELQAEFGAEDNYHEFTPEDAIRIRHRQRH